MPDHYLNQCWNIFSWALRNKLQWNFDRNSNIFIRENTSENVVVEILTILFWPQCVKSDPVFTFSIKGSTKKCTCPTIESYSLQHRLYRIQKRILPKSTCLTTSFTCLGLLGNGICQYCIQYYIDRLVQERCNSIANALELHLSCTNPLISYMTCYSNTHLCITDIPADMSTNNKHSD